MKRSALIATLVFFGYFTSALFAQESIKAVIQKCEQKKSVEMTYIINKDPETKKVLSNITTVKIKDDPALVKEFVSAFEKDKDKAYSVSGSIKNGVSTPSNYKFSSGKESYISCTMSVSNNNADASISYRESPNKPGNAFSVTFMNGELLDGSWQDIASEMETFFGPSLNRGGGFRFDFNDIDSTLQKRIREFRFNPDSLGDFTHYNSFYDDGTHVITVTGKNSSETVSTGGKSSITVKGTGSTKRYSIEN